jgi:hypothetical protein
MPTTDSSAPTTLMVCGPVYKNVVQGPTRRPDENPGWCFTLRGWSGWRFLAPILRNVDPLAPLRSVGGRLAPPMEALAQSIAERVIGLVVGAVDVNALLDEVDLNAVLDRIDLDGLLDRVDLEAILNRVDIESVLDRVDMNRLLARVDVNQLLAHVDMNRLVGTVDITAIVAQVDVNQVVQQVDVDGVIRKVDLDAVMDRVDVNEIVGRIDVDALVEETDLGSIIARSSSGVASDVLDVVRSQTVGLDEFMARWVGRILRRPYTGPPGPPAGSAARALS